MLISEQAAKELKRLLDSKGKKILRISVSGGACHEFNYTIAPCSKKDKSKTDKVLVLDEYEIIFDPKSSMYLEDLELIFEEFSKELKFEKKKVK